MEPLEARTFLSGAHLQDVQLIVRGAGGADQIRVMAHHDRIVAKVNDQTWTFAVSDVASVYVKAFGAGSRVVVGRRVPPALVVGQMGLDTIIGGDGFDTLIGHHGGNVLRSRGSDDLVTSHAGDDRLIAGAMRDTLIGGSGKDTLVAAASGGDLLLGGSGDDLFYSRNGQADTILGGSANNTAVVNQGVDSVSNIQNVLT